MNKFYLHILSRDNTQRICTSDSTKEGELNRLKTEGWIVQDTKEFTNLELAVRTKKLLEETLDKHGRMRNV